MKTTIVLPDDLFAEVKRVAAAERTSIRDFIERSVRAALDEARLPSTPFRLRDCSVDGAGMSPRFATLDWAQIRAAIHEGRGG